MFDLGWSEAVVVGALALVVIGPKELPKVMYAFGRWAGKARRFAMDMRCTLDEVAREAEDVEQNTKNGPSDDAP
ncbi:MAG: Sec-independent protein translocase protein TatB [Alphaproteobacteria bacterium]|nr:Sec-independent protein translocase protein TatB [Alphaproteobacteria bacterium]